jgi:hypothetical protein
MAKRREVEISFAGRWNEKSKVLSLWETKCITYFHVLPKIERSDLGFLMVHGRWFVANAGA